MWKHREEKTTIYKAEREAWEETNPADTLILDFQAPAPWENPLLLFKLLSVWHFPMADLANYYTLLVILFPYRNITFSMCKSIHLPLYGFWVVIFFFKSWFKRTLPSPHYKDISTPPSYHFCHCYLCYCCPVYLFCVIPYLKYTSVTWVWSGPNFGVAHCLYYFCAHNTAITIVEVDFGHRKTFMIHI